MAIYTNSVPSRGTDYSFPNPQSTGLIGDYEAYSSISLESIELGNADVTKKKRLQPHYLFSSVLFLFPTVTSRNAG